MNKDIIIIGCGPSGITAAIYAKRAGFNPIIIEKYMHAHITMEIICHQIALFIFSNKNAVIDIIMAAVKECDTFFIISINDTRII